MTLQVSVAWVLFPLLGVGSLASALVPSVPLPQRWVVLPPLPSSSLSFLLSWVSFLPSLALLVGQVSSSLSVCLKTGGAMNFIFVVNIYKICLIECCYKIKTQCMVLKLYMYMVQDNCLQHLKIFSDV